jgi:hypothetical protein|tara:strand:- start:640 stop:1110 length:471 start_codon:yes stop_codon:yes gene_type:complete
MPISKVITKAFDEFAKSFANITRSGQSFESLEPVDSPLPKMSDLKSFRDTEQFEKVKKTIAPQQRESLSEGMGAKISLSDDFLSQKASEIFDTDVYGDFASSDMWFDFSKKEISNMVNELKGNARIPNKEIPEYFQLLGGADPDTVDFVEYLLESE